MSPPCRIGVAGDLHDVVEGRARLLEADLDVLADALDLGRHVALADDVAVEVARHLSGHVDHPLAAGDRQDVPIELLPADDAGHEPGRLVAFTRDSHRAVLLLLVRHPFGPISLGS